MTHDPNDPRAPGGFGQPPQQGGFGQPPAQGGFGQPPQQGGFGQPPQQGGFGQPPAQGGFGQPPQQGGFGQPPAQGGFGQPPQQGGFGQPPQQGGFGQPPAQGGFGQPPQQGGFGQPPAQGGFGQPPSFGASFPTPGVSNFTGAASGASGMLMGRMLLGCIPSVLITVGVLAYAGWQMKNAMAPFANGTVPGVTAPATPADPDDAMNAKLDRYIMNCINLFTERAADSRHRYLSWVDATTGPTGRERNVHGLYTFPIETTRCTNAITEASNVGPDDTQLEAAGAQYATALNTLAPLLVEANTYYDRQNYKDDDFAKGRTLHPQLMTAFTAFGEAATALRREVDVRQDAVTDRLLARIQTDPTRRLEFLVRTSMKTAKLLIRLSDASRIENYLIVGVNEAQFGQLAAQYEQTIDQMTQFATANPNQARGFSTYSSFQSEAGSFLVTLKKFARRLKNHEPFTDSNMRVIVEMDMGYSVDGAPQQLWRSYDSLVDSYNRLR